MIITYQSVRYIMVCYLFWLDHKLKSNSSTLTTFQAFTVYRLWFSMLWVGDWDFYVPWKEKFPGGLKFFGEHECSYAPHCSSSSDGNSKTLFLKLMVVIEKTFPMDLLLIILGLELVFRLITEQCSTCK